MSREMADRLYIKDRPKRLFLGEAKGVMGVGEWRPIALEYG